jgi:Flp pilus assembly protein TadD
VGAMLVFFVAQAAMAAGSSSMSSYGSDKDIDYYNDGVALMLDKKFADAEKKFRKALSERERFAEAHNNLAYVLRKQGDAHYDEALKHYNRAISINPRLAEAYMYRGVLYVQMGNMNAAGEDYATLKDMRPSLAEELSYVIENRREKAPEQFFGVTRNL